jgi:hypothetical protein
MPIFFIVHALPGETDILTAICKEPLRVINEHEEVVFTSPAPGAGWTQASLERTTVDIKEYPLDAYLGTEWVGSTEV